jgi:phosphoesterase RecJ-like protein
MWDRVIALLDGGRRFVLTTHVSPDGDGIGCQLALSRTLSRMGKEAAIINPTGTQPRYEFLLRKGEVRVYRDAERGVLDAADAIFVLDINRWERLGVMQEPVRAAPGEKCCIDHHPAPEFFGDADVIDPGASATGLLVYDLVRRLAGEIPRDAVDPLYVAIMTDTGSFRFANTNSRTLRVAAELVDLGARPDRLYRSVYEANSRGRMQLLGEVLRGLQYENGGAIVHFTITSDMFDRCQVSRDEADGFTDVVRSVEGSDVVLAFSETEEGGTKVSLRSKGGALDVSRVARDWGGGGHENASGVVDPRPVSVVRAALVADVKRRLSRVGSA